MPFIPVTGRRIWRAFLDKLLPFRRRHKTEYTRNLRPRLEALEDRMAPAALGVSLLDAGGFSLPIAIAAPGSSTVAGPNVLTIPAGKTTAPPVPPAPVQAVNGNGSVPAGKPIVSLPPTILPPVLLPASPGSPGSPGSSGSSGSAGTSAVSTGSSSVVGSGSAVTGSGSGTGATTVAGNTPAPTNVYPGGIFVPTGQLTLTGVPITSPIAGGQNGQSSAANGSSAGFTQQTGSSMSVSGTGSAGSSLAYTGGSGSASAVNTGGQAVPSFFASGTAGGLYVPQAQLTVAASTPSPVASSPAPAVDLSSGLSTPQTTPAVSVPLSQPSTAIELSAVPPSSNGTANGGSYTLLAGTSNTVSSTDTSTQITNPLQTPGTDHNPEIPAPMDAPVAPTNANLSAMGSESVLQTI